MYEYLDKRYAVALYEIAEKHGRVEEYIETLREVVDIIYNNEGILQILKNPKVSTYRKKKAITDLFKGKMDDELLAFLLILINKGRILYLREKLEEVEKIYLEKNNTLTAEIKTVFPLTDINRNSLIEKLELKYGKKILLREEIDKDIIGGILVNINGTMIDGTIRTRLRNIKEAAMKSKWR